MRSLIEFAADGNKSVLVEINDRSADGLMPASAPGAVGRSEKSFEEAVSGLGPISKALFDAINSVARRPTEVSIELGFKISGKGTLILCSAETEANFTATLKWASAERSDTPGS